MTMYDFHMLIQQLTFLSFSPGVLVFVECIQLFLLALRVSINCVVSSFA